MDAITDGGQILHAYNEFARVVNEGGTLFTSIIGYQGNSREEEGYWHDDLQLWIVLKPNWLDNRYWCAFGVNAPHSAPTLSITCEINSPKEGVNRRCAGLFARNDGGALFLMHSGKIGGGRAGIGKGAFLNHLQDADVVSISFPGGKEWDYISIGGINNADFKIRLANFVHSVARIKKEIIN